MTATAPPTTALHVLGIAHLQQRIRGRVGGLTVLDSTRAALVTETRAARRRPRRAVQRSRQRCAGAYRPPRRRDHLGAGHYLDLVYPTHTVPYSAWTYQVDELRDHVGLRADAVQQWSEEDVLVHPRSPFHRVDAIRSTRHVIVRSGDRILADTHRPVALFETNIPTRWYVPVQDVRGDEFVGSAHRVPYKGIASYRALAAEPDQPVQWYYPAPLPEVADIDGHVAFYDDRVEVVVDGALVPITNPATPQEELHTHPTTTDGTRQ